MWQSAPTAAEVQEALDRVLARPEFAETPRSGLLALLDAAQEWIRAMYEALLERLNLVDVGGGVFFWIVRGWLVVTAVLLVAHLVSGLAGVRRGRVRRAPAVPGAAPVAAPGRPDWAAAMERAAEAGRFREAVLALYQWLLEQLQRQDAIRYDAAKTPGDYRRELRGHPERSRGLDRFLRHFEPVAFGVSDPDRSVFERLRSLARETVGE